MIALSLNSSTEHTWRHNQVLARYSGEHTVLRELLQNSDDAGAKTVEIHFNTSAFLAKKGSGQSSGQPPSDSDALTIPSSSSTNLPNLTKEPLQQWEFRNDGIPFREEDWNRLKKIAEGNPVSPSYQMFAGYP